MKARVILTTSEIQAYGAPGRFIATIKDRNGKELQLRSTGLLEEALQRGHDVYIVSTRAKPVEATDRWWLDLLGEKNAFFASEDDDAAGWKRFLEAEKLAWPTQGELMDKDEDIGRYGEFAKNYAATPIHITRVPEFLKLKGFLFAAQIRPMLAEIHSH